jgi:hypothetical protein
VKTYTINGVTAHAEEITSDDGTLEGYRVVVNGQYVGNRIERHERADGDAQFESIARNELIIATRAVLRDAVEDVLNDGMRDRGRR